MTLLDKIILWMRRWRVAQSAYEYAEYQSERMGEWILYLIFIGFVAVVSIVAFCVNCRGDNQIMPLYQSGRGYLTRYVASGTYQPPLFSQSVLYYQFNEYTNTAGKIVDTSNVGTNIGTPYALYPPIHQSWTASTGGTSAFVNVNDGGEGGVKIGTQSNLAPTDKITISCWLKMIPSNFASQPIIARGSSAGSPFSYAFHCGGTPLSVIFYISIGGSLKSVTAPAVSANTWTHYTGTYDGSTVAFYTNAVSVGTPVSVSGAIDNPALTLYLSYFEDLYTANLAFSIDNVYIVSGGAWSAADVLSDFNATKGAHGL